MGNSNSNGAIGMSNDIDASGNMEDDVQLQLLNSRIQELFKFKVLLLGAGESGKSTIVKQMKLVHSVKIPDSDRPQVAISLHLNVLECMKSLVRAAETFKIKIPDEHADTIKQMDEKYNDLANNHAKGMITPELCFKIKDLYQTEQIQKVYSQRNKFHLLDSWEYYESNLDRFCQPGFIPTDDDIIMARIRTTGIVVTTLKQKIAPQHPCEPNMLTFEVVDVGGQRNERKKWMHCFDDVKAVLFIVNLAGYNQVLFEDNTRNRLLESLELFGKIASNPFFKDSKICVILNKKDLFEKMILEVDMNEVFADYTGGKNLNNAVKYIKDAFISEAPPGKDISFELISAKLRKEIRDSFTNVKNKLYHENRTNILEQAAALTKEKEAREKQFKKAEKANARAANGGGRSCNPFSCCMKPKKDAQSL